MTGTINYNSFVCMEYAAGFFRYGEANRDARLTKGNDISSPPLMLRWGMPFFNKKYWKLYVNDNGVLSFENSVTDHSEKQESFPVGDLPDGKKQILIAPFYANVDITESGQIYYRQSNEQDLLDRCDRDVHQYFVLEADFKSKYIVIATWEGVSFYGYSGGAAPVNTFQVVVATDEIETFVFFRYNQIDWTTGTESGGSANTGLGSFAAKMGFNSGDGDIAFVEQGYSGRSEKLVDLNVAQASPEQGMFMYHVSGTSVQELGCNKRGVETYPQYDSMLGHSWLLVSGPCYDRTKEHWLLFGTVDEPIAITNCTYHSTYLVYCFTPTFFQVGTLDIRLSVDDGATWPNTGTFDVVKIGDTPQLVTRVNPDSEGWLRADRPVTIEWDPRLINFTYVRIDILAYNEPIDPDTGEPGPPTWEEIDEVSYTAENIGRFTWTSQAVSVVTDKNCMGVIRVTRRFKRDDLALWSDLHFLGYILNDKFQRDPAVYANLRCEEFFDREKEEGHDVFLSESLRPCPCNLTQALADRGRFKPDPMCNMDDAVQDRTQEYCRFRDDVVHCVASIVPSATNFDSSCCYDEFENLVYAGDSSSGGFSHYVTVEGVPPYAEAGKVPQLSSAIADYAPYFMCCIWGDHCDYYQEVRPTRDCRWYRNVRPGTVFGDPHFMTFDGAKYTFNAKGEYTVFQTTSSSPTSFEVQGRFEQILDHTGIPRKATVLTAVAMQQEDLPRVMILKSDRRVIEVYIENTVLDPGTQTTIRRDGYFITLPNKDEKGNLTQVIVTFTESEISVVVNGTQEMLTAQVLVPYRYRDWMVGLLGSWNDNIDDDLQSKSGKIFSPNDDEETLFRDFGQSWEITSQDTLFHYIGPGHEYYQDNTFIPDFEPPSDVGIINPDDLERICGDNAFCEYDLQTTGNIELAKATMLAYNQHILAYGASFDLITCEYLKTPKNGTKTFLRKRNHQVGAEVEFACEDNFILVGSPYLVCEPPQGSQSENPQGQWSGISKAATCVESIICGGLRTPEYSSIEVSGPPENLRVSYLCDENYKRYGNKNRYCKTEKERWTGIEPYCMHQFNPVEIAGIVIGTLAGAVILVVLVAACIVMQFGKKGKKSAIKPPRVQKKDEFTTDRSDYGEKEPGYPIEDSPVEVHHSDYSPEPATKDYPLDEDLPPGGEQAYATTLREHQYKQKGYYGSREVVRPSPHSSQHTIPYPETDPFPAAARMPPPEMISPTEPRYAYTDPGEEDIGLELKHGKSLESWA